MTDQDPTPAQEATPKYADKSAKARAASLEAEQKRQQENSDLYYAAAEKEAVERARAKEIEKELRAKVRELAKGEGGASDAIVAELNAKLDEQGQLVQDANAAAADAVQAKEAAEQAAAAADEAKAAAEQRAEAAEGRVGELEAELEALKQAAADGGSEGQ